MTARVALEKVDGVEKAEVSYETGSATVTFDPGATNPETFIAELARLTDCTAALGEGDGAVVGPDGHATHDTTNAHE